MKTITTILILLSSLLITANATNAGEEIFKTNCTACHSLKMPRDMNKSQRMKMMREMKAPPIAKVSAKLKHALDNNRTKVIAFVEDYIQNPDANKSLCMPMAVKRFGVMPPVKGLTKEQRTAVGTWLYDNFKNKWMNSRGACKADMNMTSHMKCGNGKCGGAMMKAKEKAPMKCGAGKCGGGK